MKSRSIDIMLKDKKVLDKSKAPELIISLGTKLSAEPEKNR